MEKETGGLAKCPVCGTMVPFFYTLPGRPDTAYCPACGSAIPVSELEAKGVPRDFVVEMESHEEASKVAREMGVEPVPRPVSLSVPRTPPPDVLEEARRAIVSAPVGGQESPPRRGRRRRVEEEDEEYEEPSTGEWEDEVPEEPSRGPAWIEELFELPPHPCDVLAGILKRYEVPPSPKARRFIVNACRDMDGMDPNRLYAMLRRFKGVPDEIAYHVASVYYRKLLEINQRRESSGVLPGAVPGGGGFSPGPFPPLPSPGRRDGGWPVAAPPAEENHDSRDERLARLEERIDGLESTLRQLAGTLSMLAERLSRPPEPPAHRRPAEEPQDPNTMMMRMMMKMMEKVIERAFPDQRAERLEAIIRELEAERARASPETAQVLQEVVESFRMALDEIRRSRMPVDVQTRAIDAFERLGTELIRAIRERRPLQQIKPLAQRAIEAGRRISTSTEIIEALGEEEEGEEPGEDYERPPRPRRRRKRPRPGGGRAQAGSGAASSGAPETGGEEEGVGEEEEEGGEQ